MWNAWSDKEPLRQLSDGELKNRKREIIDQLKKLKAELEAVWETEGSSDRELEIYDQLEQLEADLDAVRAVRDENYVKAHPELFPEPSPDEWLKPFVRDPVADRLLDAYSKRPPGKVIQGPWNPDHSSGAA